MIEFIRLGCNRLLEWSVPINTQLINNLSPYNASLKLNITQYPHFTKQTTNPPLHHTYTTYVHRQHVIKEV